MATLCYSMVTMATVYLILVFIYGSAIAFSIPSFRQAAGTQQMNNPNVFMDPSFTAGRQLTAGQSDSQSQALQGVNTQVVMSGPPLGSGTQGVNQVQVSNDKGNSASSADATAYNRPVNQGIPGSNPNNVDADQVPQGPNLQNSMVRPNVQVSGSLSATATGQNEGIQQTVSGSYMFNPGQMGSALQAPPGTGNSQFNNNIGSRNSMLNQFGGSGLSVDPSQFFKPKENPDGSISGAAGNAFGPPTIGPMAALNGGVNNNNSNNNNNNKNNNNNNNNNNSNNKYDYNSMFGPPNFFMNPGSSFGQK